ncbi:MAG TPA: PTS transporter subunit IIC [Limnochordales bacterium]
MQVLDAIVNWVLNVAGVTVMFPFMVFMIGLVFRARPAQLFRSALMIASGITGLLMVLSLLIGSLAPATQAMADRFHLQLTISDVGWPTLAAISFGTTYAFTLFVVIFALNVVLILLNWVRTLDIDLWNYWSFAFVFSMTWVVTRSFPLALLAAMVYAVFCFKLADWTAPVVADYFKMPGITTPHGDSVVWSPIGMALDALWDRIPGIRDIRWEAGALHQRLGVLGEPAVVGFLIGLLVGAFGYLRLPLTGEAVAETLKLGIAAAAYLVLMPRMISLLMDGLLPIAEAARTFVMSRFPGRAVYIGVDAAVLVGDTAIVATALLMTPITLLIAALLPGNRVLPFADLSVLVFLLIWAVAPSRGNVFRSLLNAILVVVPVMLLMATDLAPQVTAVAREVGADVPPDTLVTAMAAGFKVLAWPILMFAWALGGSPVPPSKLFLAAVVLAAYLGLIWLVRHRPSQRFAVTGAQAPGQPAQAAGRGAAARR